MREHIINWINETNIPTKLSNLTTIIKAYYKSDHVSDFFVA